MTKGEIRDLLRSPDFQPMVIKMNNGDRFEVPHPEFVVVTSQGSLHIYKPDPSDPAFPSYSFVAVATHNVSSIEPIARQKSA